VTVQVIVRSSLVAPPLFVECTGRKISIGRGEGASVRLPDPTVSLEHATLRKRGQDYLITDEGSTNGTALLSPRGEGPVWLPQGSARVVPPGGRLLLGQVELELRMDGTAEGLPSEDLARDLVTAGLASLDLELTEDLIESSLAELTASEDEVMRLPDGEPAEAREDGGVVSESSDRSVADWFIAALSLCVLLVSAGALYWLLR